MYMTTLALVFAKGLVKINQHYDPDLDRPLRVSLPMLATGLPDNTAKPQQSTPSQSDTQQSEAHTSTPDTSADYQPITIPPTAIRVSQLSTAERLYRNRTRVAELPDKCDDYDRRHLRFPHRKDTKVFIRTKTALRNGLPINDNPFSRWI